MDAVQAAPAPMVSGIIIFLNGETYIEEAIQSVLAQTLTDWELILVDDGSTDGATAIARKYAEDYPGKIIYTEHPGHQNCGMSASRNAGLRLARGKYISFLDADDIWLPERLSHHVEILEAHPDVVMSMGPTLLWSSWSNPKEAARRPWMAADIPTELGLPVMTPFEPPIVAIGFLEKHGGNVPGICSLMVRREELLALGGFEDSFRTLYEDQVFFFKIGLNCRIIATDRILDYYRQHPGSACHQAGGMSGDAKMRPVFLEWLQDYLIDNGFKSRRLWKAFRGEMLRFDRPGLWRMQNIPSDIVDQFNVRTRRAVIFLLTPRFYTWLRRKLRLSVVDVTNVR
ncbi:MAG: glycosyltransferase family 2 protein [Roseivivax sp.]|nr:glycosyltransferase family 2 protein [Roseivivax sp.]